MCDELNCNLVVVRRETGSFDGDVEMIAFGEVVAPDSVGRRRGEDNNSEKSKDEERTGNSLPA